MKKGVCQLRRMIDVKLTFIVYFLNGWYRNSNLKEWSHFFVKT